MAARVMESGADMFVMRSSPNTGCSKPIPIAIVLGGGVTAAWPITSFAAAQRAGNLRLSWRVMETVDRCPGRGENSDRGKALLIHHRVAPRLLLELRDNSWEEEHMPVRLATLTLTATAGGAAVGNLVVRVRRAADTTLDYEYFKAKVQPIFLTKRAGPCALRDVPRRRQQHAEAAEASRRARRAWGEEDTRKNFDTVSKIIHAVDDPLTAQDPDPPARPRGGRRRLPLRRPAVRQPNDPHWKTITDWPRARSPAGRQEIAPAVATPFIGLSHSRRRDSSRLRP